MGIKCRRASIALALCCSTAAFANSDMELLRQEIHNLRQNYEQRIQALEARLEIAEQNAKQSQTRVTKVEQQVANVEAPRGGTTTANAFNPAISLVLNGRYANFDNEAGDYELPGFALGNEAGLGESGMSLGHTEIIASANIDDRFYGQVTAAIDEHDGETEVELEEAFLQTIGLGNGLTIKAGRFFSAMGYLNDRHEHTWDFADAPLIYRGLFGNQLRDDGLQISYIAPTDLFLELGVEAFRGSRFPAGGEQDNVGAWTGFAHIGGDIGVEHSWMLGVSHWRADDIEGRTSGGHAHGHESEEEEEETPSFTGDSSISAFDLVYKWAPNGNPTHRNFQFQFEYFDRDEDGTVTLLNSDPLEVTRYDGQQSGWYAQTVYQFMPQWRAGLRYDELDSDNKGSDFDLLGEAGLDDEGHTPKRYSAMLEWLPSEFSRIRLQFNRDESYEDSDNQLFLQYTHSIGSHGAHKF